MTALKAAYKFIDAVETYFEYRTSSTIAIADLLAGLPDETQEHVFEMCVNYIYSVADRKEFYGGMMRHYHDVAKKMVENN